MVWWRTRDSLSHVPNGVSPSKTNLPAFSDLEYQNGSNFTRGGNSSKNLLRNDCNNYYEEMTFKIIFVNLFVKVIFFSNFCINKNRFCPMESAIRTSRLCFQLPLSQCVSLKIFETIFF